MLEFWNRSIACMFLFLTVMMVIPFSCSQTIDEIFSRLRGERSEDPEEGEQPNVPVVEYDMLLPKDLYAEMTRLSFNDSSRGKRKAVRDLTKRWPSAVVPYEISAAYTSDDVTQVNSAIRDWMTHTCLLFRPRQPGDKSWVYFREWKYCRSYIGRQGDRQNIYLNKRCRTKKIIIHEIGHAIGFVHEQSRPDRDDYIRIIRDNLQFNGNENNFAKWSRKHIDTYGVPYDYKSIMHYGQTAFSYNNKKTIETVDPRMQGVIGRAQTLSFLDIKLANLMYNCNAHCSDALRCPPDSFLGRDCICWCQGDPVSECKSCGGNLSSSSGSFNSPNFPLAYNNYSNCKWAIQVPSGRITLTFTAFRVEPCSSGTVNYDAVFVYDGATESAPLLSRLCGTTRPLPIRSSGNVMLVKFTSDIIYTDTGFNATYRSPAGCGGNLSSSSGSFNSPNFPLAYNNNGNCKWAIQVPSGRITLTFTEFKVEPCSSGTVYDAVFVYDGATESAPLLTRLCGVTRPLPIRSSGSVMLVKFISDIIYTDTGFNATYTSTAGKWLPWNPWGACSVTCNGGKHSRTRSCEPADGNCIGSGAETQKCGQKTCPGRWLPWSPWGACSVTCNGGKHSRTRSCEPADGNCIGSGAETQNCGQETCPTPVPSLWGEWNAWSSCSVTCDVGTQERTRYCLGRPCPGLSRQTKRCQESPCKCASQTLTTLSGAFASPNYPSTYPDDSKCRWTIQVVSGLLITLSFQDFRLERCSSSNVSSYDFLNVHDGATESSPRMAHLCGTTVPQPVTSTGNVMLVVFNSDGSQTFPGFNATYVTETGPNTGSIKLMSCDFEIPCTQMRIITDSDIFDWQRKMCCTPSVGTGPKGDHTLGKETGHFMYTEATDVPAGTLSRMRNEPPFTHNHDNVCVRFWYHMQGRYMGTLSIFYLENGEQDKKIWTVTGHQSHVWKEKRLTIPTKPNQKFQVEFEAIRGRDYQSDIAIDDVLISSGSCGAQVLLSCDFETPCDYLMPVPPNNDRFGWKRQQCCTNSSRTGPNVDHTKGTKNGHFMYTEASDMLANQTAYLHTEPALRNTNTQACLRFWYHMKVSKMASLEIQLENNTSIWRRQGQQGDQWHEAVVTFTTPVNQGFQLGFRATRGEDYKGDIAIDDVTIKSGRCAT